MKIDCGPKPAKVKGLIDTKEKLSSYLAKENNTEIKEYENESAFETGLKFDYQDSGEEKLSILKNEFGLKQLVSSGRSQLEKFVLLRDWVRRQWSYGHPQNISGDYDALDILRRSRKNERFWCSEYAVVFIQSALSLGYQARYAGLNKGHVVAEIWSDEFKKWIVMDPTFNIHFEKNGIVLNCFELRDIFNGGRFDEVKVIEGDYKPQDICLKFGVHEFSGISLNNYPYKTIDYYAEGFSVRMRNDWFTNKYPRLHPKGNMFMNRLSVSKKSSLKSGFYPLLNLTTIGFEVKNSRNFNVFLATFTPNFSHFNVYIDNKEKQDGFNGRFEWALHSGMNFLKTAAVNKSGVKGKDSVIVLNKK